MSTVLEMPQAVRACVKCGQTKPLDDYYKDRRITDGRHARCKSCFNAINNARRAVTRKRNAARRAAAKAREAAAIRREMRRGEECVCGYGRFAHLNGTGHTALGCPEYFEAGT